MSSVVIPSSVQQVILRANLNGALLNTFLFGIYTVIFLGAVYTYSVKQLSKNWVVIGTISLSYLIYTIQTAAAWYILLWTFVDNGQTQETVYFATVGSPGWYLLLNDISSSAMVALADILLIWRCFHVWDRSLRAISFPLFLLLSEIAVYLYIIIVPSMTHLDPSPKQARQLTLLIGVSYIMTIITSSVTTFLIAYRIHSVSKQDLLSRSKSQFKHVFDILIQSSAAFTLAAIPISVATLLPVSFQGTSINPNSVEVTVLQTSIYTSMLYYFAAGVVPTIMVARVSLATDRSTNISAATHITGLQFRNQTTTANTSQAGGIHSRQVEDRSHGLFQESKDGNVKGIQDGQSAFDAA